MNNHFIILMVLFFFSACSGGGGGGASSGTKSRTSPHLTPNISCESNLDSESGDHKELSCSNNTNISYSPDNNALCRIDDLNGVAVSTCMETGLTLSAQSCTRAGESVNCPNVDFSCEVSSLSTSDNWILSCDDEMAASMDISNGELCRIDLPSGTGFCLDDENRLNKLPVVWSGYASNNIIGIGEEAHLNIPMWGPLGTTFRYSATPENICSVEAETGRLSVDAFGECRVSLTVSASNNSKVIEKMIYGRLSQDTDWSGYSANSMDFGGTLPSLSSPQYPPDGVSYNYSSETPDVCTVDANTGAITAPTDSGDCIITMTSSATNFADRSISFTLRVDPLTLPTSLTWTNPYGSGPFDILTTVSAPSAGAVTGQGSLSVALENYRSTTPTICSVDETTGVPTLLLNGDCTIETSASALGYETGTLTTTLTIDLAPLSLGWTSPLTSLGVTDSVQPNTPTGIPGAAAVAGLTYSTTTSEICGVDASTGEVTGIANGSCEVEVTGTFPGYAPGSATLSITIATYQENVAWEGYSSLTETTFGRVPSLSPPTDSDPIGATFAYSSLTTDVCTVDENGALTLVDDGDCKIRMISSAVTYGDKLFEHDLRILPADLPVLGWGTLYGDGGGSFDVEDTGLVPIPENLVGLPGGVTATVSNVESSTPDICTTDENGMLTFLRDGDCNLRAMVSVNGYNDQAVEGTMEVVSAAIDDLVWTGYNDNDNTITFGDAAPALVAPVLTTTTDHTLSYESGDTDICTVDAEGALTILRDGDCVITLTASAPGYTAPDSIQSTLTIAKATMSVTWGDYSPNLVAVGDSVEVTAPTGVPDGASISYSVNDENICSVSAEGRVTAQAAGTCTVTLTISLLGYNDFITDANTSRNVTITSEQMIEWTGYSESEITFNDTTPTLNPPTDEDGSTVAYTSLTTDICTVDSSGALTILDHGTCTIHLTATKSGVAMKVIPFNLTISPLTMSGFDSWSVYDAETVVFPSVPGVAALPTEASPSDATLNYTSETEDICTVDATNGTLTAVDDGTCTVNVMATKAGYTPSEAGRVTITITSADISGLAWTGYSAGSVAYGATPPTLNAPTGGPSGVMFRYSSNDLTICVVDPENGALTLSGVSKEPEMEGGDRTHCRITLTASAAGYNDNSDNTFDVMVNSRAISSMTWSGYSSNTIDFNDTSAAPVQPDGVPRWATFSYSSTTPDICGVDSGTGALVYVDDGSCTITLTASAANYSNATADATLTINPIDFASLVWSGYTPDSISFRDRDTLPTFNAPTGMLEGTTFGNYSSADDMICTVDETNGALTAILDAGTCTINVTASTPGYNDKTLTANVMITPLELADFTWAGYGDGSPDISVAFSSDSSTAPTLIPPENIPTDDPDISSGYTSSDESICSVDSTSGALTLVDDGTCEITFTVSKRGYSDIPKTFSFTITPIDLMGNLTWNGYPSSMVIRGSIIYPSSVTGVTPETTYRYTTSTPDICSVDEEDGGVWGLDLGTCSVTATVNIPGYNDITLPTVNVATARESITINAFSSCALLSSGQVKCWGRNNVGQLMKGNQDTLGDDSNEMGSHLSSVNLGTDTGDSSGRALKVKLLRSANVMRWYGHTCALFDNNKIKCWGRNGSGQLGLGNKDNIGDDSGEMGNALSYLSLGQNADRREDHTVKSIGLGNKFTCAILDNNRVKCWGENRYGQLGLGHIDNTGDNSGEMGDALSYVNLGNDTSNNPLSVKDISLGHDHVCALLESGQVKCWGYNHYGQLGQGDTINRGDNATDMQYLGAIDLGEDVSAKRVSVGGFHSCVITNSNDLLCWGRNVDTALGIDHDSDNTNIGDASDEMGDNLSATHLVSQDAVYVNGGYYSTCVIRQNGNLYCWGNNNDGILGLGNTQQKGDANTDPEDVDVSLGDNRSVRMAQINREHGCALLDNNDIKCWGKNNHGQLGQGDTTNRGADSSDMGNNLAAVDIIPDILDLVWEGYSSALINYAPSNGNTPTLMAPTGGPSGETLTFAYEGTSGICTANSGTGALNITNNGTCTVTLTASLTGHRDEVRTFDITVNPVNMSLGWTGYGSNTATFPTAPTITAPVSPPSGVSYSYTSTTTNVCTVDGAGALTLARDGTCTIQLTATASGYNNKVVSHNIAVAKGTMSSLAWTGYSGNNETTFPTVPTLLAPTGGPSGATFAYTSQTTGICTVTSAGVLTLVTNGTCTIRLTASATGYNNRSIDKNITVNRGTMTNLAWIGYSSNSVSFPSAPSLRQPTNAPSGATFAYTSQTTAVCTVTNAGVLTLVTNGTCTIRLTASATGYNSKTIDKSINVSAGNMSNLAWTGYASASVNFPDTPPSLRTPTGAPSGATFEYSSQTTAVCSVTSVGVLTLVKDGTCTIRLTARATGYNDKTIDQSITIKPGEMSNLVWAGYSGNNRATFPTAPTLSAPTGAPSGATFEYSSQTTAVCSVTSAGVLTLVKNGDCIIRLITRATGYKDTIITKDVTINKGTMSNLAWTGYSASTATVSGTAPTLSAPTGAPSGATFTYSTGTTTVCSVTLAGVLTIQAAGTCTVTLNVSATGYVDKAIDQDITVTE